MSRIDDLIRELCPEGVPVFNLGDLIQENLGGGTPSRSDASLWNGSIPWASVGDLTASKLEIGYTRQSITEAGLASSSTNLIPEGWVVAAVKIAPGEMRVVRSPLAINQDLRGLRLSETVDPQFLVYLSKTISVKGNGTIVKGITNESLKKLQIPVPPLEVQREIVSILDKFTQLEAELEAELEARRIQYEVTRDRLLDFSGELEGHPLGARISSLCPSGIQVRPLGDLVINRDSERKPVTRGLRQAGKYPYYGANGIQDYVDSYLFEGTFLLIGEDGSVMRMDGTPVLNWASGQIWVNNHAHVLQARAEGPSLRFLYFFLSTVDVSNFVTGGT